MTAPTLIVFDLDGTLVDSRRDIAEAMNEALTAWGAPALPEVALGRMVGDGAGVLVARACAAAGLPMPADGLAQFLSRYDARLTRWTRPYAGTVETLTALADRATLAVLTNKPLAATHQVLGDLGLASFFGARVLGGDGPQARKPDPAGLSALWRAHGTGPDATLMVGDSVVDFRTARAAGTRICMARYGFCYDDFPRHELAAHDLVIDRPADLLRLLSDPSPA